MKGEHTYASEISAVPAGSLRLGLNLNISKEGIAEPRRGFNFLDYSLPDTDDRAKKLVFWNDSLFVHYNSTFAYYNPASGFSSRGALSAPSNAQSVRAVTATNKNLYLSSSVGLRKTDAIGTSLYAAGIPPALNIELALAGAGTALSNTKFVTYQFLIGRKDANANTQQGPVSGRYTIGNSAGSTQNVTLQCYLPSGLDTSYFIQVYKTREAASAAATGEEPQMFFEAPITSTDISNGYVTVTDITPDSLVLGAYIYTAPSQGGISGNNATPPLARDIAEFRNCLFFADVESKHFLTFSLISVGGTGLVANDTVVISNGTTTETYTAKAAYNAAANEFAVVTAGSPAQNIDDTIKSFIRLVNAKSALVYAFSLSTGATDLPGRVMLEARALGSAAFTAVCAARSAAWQPQLTSPATVNNTSTSDQYKNGIMWSKAGQHEAVPKKYLAFAGGADDRIERILALRDGLFIFKKRDGAFTLRGDNESNFTVKELDSTAKLVAQDSLAKVTNSIYGLFENGICEVSDTGVSIISIPIQDQLQPLLGENVLAVTRSLAFGISNDTDGKYILSVPTRATDTYTVRQHIFDVFGRSFCKWDFRLFSGGVDPSNAKLHLGLGDKNKIRQERRAFDYTDHADFGNTCTIASYTDDWIELDNVSDMDIGDILYQGNGSIVYIEEIDLDDSMVRVDFAQDWVTGTPDVTHMKAIDCKIQWNADFGGNPAGLKQYYEGELIQQQTFQKEADIYFSSDVDPSESNINFQSAAGNGAFGAFDFGAEVFGGEQAKAPLRFGIPIPHSMCSQISVRFENKVAWSDFQITGLALAFEPISTSVTR